MKELLGLSLPDLEALVRDLGEAPFRARQIAGWVYRRRATDIQAMTDLPRSFRRRLAAVAVITPLRLVERQVARDGTRKFLLGLSDGQRIESVLIPEGDRLTACLSTQVGCPLACAFCVTGLLGLKRQLTAAEVVGQVLALQGDLRDDERINHLVLMGMGEPLANYRETVRALEILTAPPGLGFPARRITLSTVGLVPQIRALGTSGLEVNLAISLSATTDALRNELMPVNRRYPLEELLGACREYPLGPRRRITFEYVLLDGVNDGAEDARRLGKVLRGIRCKVNLIPLNEAPGIPFRRPPAERVQAFQKILRDAGYIATIRESKGRDIDAACGMLDANATAGILDKSGPLHYYARCGVEQPGSSLGS